jgi:hypothetical protein
MEDLLISTIEEFGYPIMLQGSLLANKPYPDHFFTFWNRSSDAESFYDNDEKSILYEYDLNFYSIDQTLVYTILREAKAKLKKVGFMVFGDGYAVASDEPTHDGRGIKVTFLKYQ